MKNIKDIQVKLNKILNIKLVVDGDYGPSTTFAVKLFQKKYNLIQDGILGPITNARINKEFDKLSKSANTLLSFNKERFVIFVDAGHGGIDDNEVYTTSGKRGYHLGLDLHDGANYYEGLENRIVAEQFIEECTKLGIMCIRTYHPWKDASLGYRTELVRSYLKRGYYGYMHSFHSNAIAESNSKSKLSNTRGFMSFNTKGDSFSDEISTIHFNNVKRIIGKDNWVFRTQSMDDEDVDFEVNFQILRETDLPCFDNFGSILEEWGFHTSDIDTQFIINTRNERVQAAIDTAIEVKKILNLKKDELS